jgi:putative endonuclease
MQFSTYILRCADGTLYTGSTNNLEKRIHEHNTAKNGAHYTKIRRPVELIYYEHFSTLGEARSREAVIKRMTKSAKLALIENK